MLGRELRNRFSLIRPPPLIEDIENKKQNIDQGNRQITFEIGQKAMVKDYRKGRKPWALGVVVEESIPGITYVVDVEGCRWKRHVNQMLACAQTLSE